MLGPVMVYVTAPAERREVGVRVIGRVVVAMSCGQDHPRRAYRLEHVVGID
jgi:hypothetical protein